MKDIELAKPWDHITPEKTTAYPAGKHNVSNEVAEAAEKAGVVKENKDGGSTGKPGASGGAHPAQG